MCQLLCCFQEPGSDLTDATASLVQAKDMDDSTGRPGTARIPNIFGQPTPTAGIMKSVLQTKIVHLPVAIADCTFLHHDQTTGKRAARCPGVKYSFLSLSLVCCTQREIMFAFWKIFIHLREKKERAAAQTLHI